jgi:outer membrane lipoprotein LolB
MLRLTSLLLAALLTACASQPTPLPPPGSWALRSAQLQALTHWRAEGKLALRSDARSESARITWEQKLLNSRLQLSGPLGVNNTVMESNGHTLTVYQGEQATRIDISTPEAVERNTGWRLPLGALPHWLKGVPAPNYPVFDIQSDNQLLQNFRQDGWQVSYTQYQEFAGYTLPTRMDITQDDTRVRVLIRHWNTNPE